MGLKKAWAMAKPWATTHGEYEYDGGGTLVGLQVHVSLGAVMAKDDDRRIFAHLTPYEARRLAVGLLNAADNAEETNTDFSPPNQDRHH